MKTYTASEVLTCKDEIAGEFLPFAFDHPAYAALAVQDGSLKVAKWGGLVRGVFGVERAPNRVTPK